MVSIHFGDLRIGAVSGSSGIFTGNNQQFGFKNTGKINQAFGHIEGEGTVILDILSCVNDRDPIDMHSSVHDPKP